MPPGKLMVLSYEPTILLSLDASSQGIFPSGGLKRFQRGCPEPINICRGNGAELCPLSVQCDFAENLRDGQFCGELTRQELKLFRGQGAAAHDDAILFGFQGCYLVNICEPDFDREHGGWH